MSHSFPSFQFTHVMSSRYPPQSRMPILVPQRTETLWYPRQTGVEHMRYELDQEEAAYEERQQEISLIGAHFIPIGLSKPFIDFEEEHEEEEEEEDEEEEEEEEEEDEEEDEGEGESEGVAFQDLDQEHDIGNNGGYYVDFSDTPTPPGEMYSADELGEERDLDDDIVEAMSYGGDSDHDDQILYSPSYQPSP